MQRVLPEDAVLVSGITNMGYGRILPTAPDNHVLSHVLLLCDPGFSFPVALGAKVAPRVSSGVHHR